MKKTKKTVLLAFLLVTLSLCFCSVSAQAGNLKNKWVHTGNQYKFYNKNEKAMWGIHTIFGKKYYFNNSRNQQTGWVKYKNDYYFFRQKRKSGGYMLTNTKVDGVTLGADGKAVVSNATVLRKLNVMVKAAQIVNSQTNPDQKMCTKRWIMFEYTKNHYTINAIPDLFTGVSDWDVAYAEWMLTRGYGDCYGFAGVFAYYLNAIGYANPIMACSGGHAWVEQKGLYYDPNWATEIGSAACYAVPKALSGQNGRPDWANNGTYKKNIDL